MPQAFKYLSGGSKQLRAKRSSQRTPSHNYDAECGTRQKQTCGSFHYLGVRFVGVPETRALIFGVYNRASDSWKLPYICTYTSSSPYVLLLLNLLGLPQSAAGVTRTLILSLGSLESLREAVPIGECWGVLSYLPPSDPPPFKIS